MLDISDKVVYQIYPKSFQDTNNDGIGDLPGIISRLPYLKKLGVDYLWLTPIYPSPQNDNGYDVADYTAINPTYGTMADFETLVAKAKALGIGIMLDMVFNHTSTEHEWFQKALAGDKKYQDYYIFKTSEKVPTNWQSKFGNSAWEYLPQLDKWHLHLFHTTQADLNWENPQLREELKDIIRFWKAKGVAGFRFDVINLISKPEVFADDFQGDGRRFYTDGPKVHSYLKELVKDTGIEDMITVGEMSSTTIDHCIKYSNPAEKELSMTFSFHHLKIDYLNNQKFHLQAADLKKLKDLFRQWGEEMQQGHGTNALFWCNHDQPRIVSRLGDDEKHHDISAKMLGTLIHTMRGVPYIYQGEEIGMNNAYFTDIEDYDDIESKNYYEILLKEGKSKEEVLHILRQHSRDNSRTPMQWDESKPYFGFSEVKPWLAIGKKAHGIDVASQVNNPASVFSHYQKLIALRKTEPTISKGIIKFLPAEETDLMVFQREYGDETTLVITNLKYDTSLHYELPTENYQVLIHNYDDLQAQENKVQLRPYESLVVKIK